MIIIFFDIVNHNYFLNIIIPNIKFNFITMIVIIIFNIM
jgi:hypothetical protein